ncbi:MAG: response regulator, partial [Halobacteriaceae archaeon]
MKAEIEVLHIEDDRGFRNLLSDYFKQINRNITVESEQSVERGIDRLESASDIDCVVSDLELPGKSGLEFLEWVRETLSNLPFILYTGKGSEAVASEAVSKGATDYLQKDGGTEEFELLANRIQNSVQQYRSRREAEQTRRRLRTLAESTPHCVWMFDSDWEELLFVSGYEEVWGRPTAAIRENPQDFLDGVHPDDREFVEDLMRQMSAGEAIDAEYRIVRGDGETGWVWAQGEPTFTDDGAVKSVVGFTRDITERKQRERRLERQNERFDELAS